MNQSVLSGKNALIAQQHRLDNIANNIANVNTYGYKAIRTDFRDMIYKTTMRPVQPQDDVNKQRGHGIIAATSTTMLFQGSVMGTDQPLDFCIEGDGYFAVEDPQSGETLYTRDGMFLLSVEGDGAYMVTGSGMYVLDTNGNRIRIPGGGNQSLQVKEDGTISVGTEGNMQEIGRFGLYTFPNRQGLLLQGKNTYSVSENSGQPMAAPASTKLHQGALENSNVDLAQEMTYMIRAQRAFQAASRAITTADTMDSTANTMRG